MCLSKPMYSTNFIHEPVSHICIVCGVASDTILN